MTTREALATYVELSQRVESFEDPGVPCACRDFFTCDNCHGYSDAKNALRSHMTYWGERYAYELAKREGLLNQEEAA